MQTVYLAGPISGLSYGGATNWREDVKDKLEGFGYKCLSPMRGKEALQFIQEFSPHGYDGVASSHNIIKRDNYDVHRSDVLFVNLLGAKKVSIGTMFEIAWAYQAGKFVLVVMEDRNIHEHAFVMEAASFIVSTLDEAVNYLIKVLNV